MELLIDTSAVIELFKKSPKALKFFREAEKIFIPSIVIGELYYGAFKALQKQKENSRILKLRAQTIELSINHSTAQKYGEIIGNLALIGKPIPQNDAWIAALSMQHNITLLIKEDKHFEYVEGLDCIIL